ncbi:3-phosphoglycerate dehydrogenase family protein [Ottowia sp.]|jgi:D-3-phosphoglycerate dehydrogenase|uniref:3-phosphoglycerate dehydrogenase family protein n=1 Tax=Ottowia sp. TaxID=1898956 RepID=UPI0025F6678D|nr:3-phosphoglycerate dehydrogenase family protein [Ottowia sp.]MBK6615111.1 3-phosphoglycerate dehydrogenase [Ottowia sp.]MBK6746188.1 3-phosphoglycerate dehydrogenase [Ottowia sp.]
MFRIKTYNQISVKGLERFARDRYEVGSDIGHPDAVLLRSHKLQGAPVPQSLLAVARAGAGVNNIPVDDYGKQGIVVFNTPGANANAVKELVLAGMLLATRGILPGIAYAQSLAGMSDSAAMHALLEKEKARFAGGELRGKTLGIVGLGAIGSMVADMALAMGMKVLGFDPALSIDAAWRLSNAVQRMENLPALLARSDYVSLHVPALDATRHLVNAAALAGIKPGAVLLNFARETIVDPAAIAQALDGGRLGRYVCDFPEPGLAAHPKVIATPHIGASTEESEENCAVMAAEQLIDFLEHGHIANSVNYPAIRMDRTPGAARITIANDNVAGVLGHVLSVLAEAQLNVIDMTNRSRGELAFNIIDVASAPAPEAIAAIAGVAHVIRVRVV